MTEPTRTCAVPLWNGLTRNRRTGEEHRTCCRRATRSAKGGTVPLCTLHYNYIAEVGFTSALPNLHRHDLDIDLGRRALSSGEGT